jgi:hypothetical protein
MSEDDEQYLQEVADGAYGDDPRARGLARDYLARLRMTTEQKLVPRGTGHCEDDNAWAEFCRQYGNKAREDLAAGKLTDFHLANAIYMADRNSLDLIGLQTAVKERIRWLSVELAKALASAPAAPAQEPSVGLEAAIRFVETRRNDYVSEHGMYDPETGATEFPDGGEYVGELEEIIDGLKALAAAPVAPAPVAVKALVFDDDSAETPFGTYAIEDRGESYIGPRYVLWILGSISTASNRRDELVAAAQADYERRVRACQVDAPVAAGWQAMETAPKDGRVILGYWSPESVESIAFRDGVWVWSCDGDSWREGSAPTYWMPLPAAPGEGQGNG